MATAGTEAWARATYGPPCEGPFVQTFIFGRNLTVHKKAVRAFKRLDRIFKEKCPAYYKAICAESDTGTYNCRKIAGTNTYSNHAFGLAIDLDWQENARDGDWKSEMRDRGMAAVKQVEKEGFMRWGGRYSSPDDMHFEVVMTPLLLRTHYTLEGKRRFPERKKR